MAFELTIEESPLAKIERSGGGGGGRKPSAFTQLAKNGFEAAMMGLEVSDNDIRAHKGSAKRPSVKWNQTDSPAEMNGVEVPAKHACFTDGEVIGEWHPTDANLLKLPVCERDGDNTDEEGNYLIRGFAVTAGQIAAESDLRTTDSDPDTADKELGKVSTFLATVSKRMSDVSDTLYCGAPVSFRLAAQPGRNGHYTVWRAARSSKSGKGKK